MGALEGGGPEGGETSVLVILMEAKLDLSGP